MLIEISGIDGTGKSTLSEQLRAFYADQGIPCFQLVLRSTYKRVLDGVAAEAGYRNWREFFGADEVETAHALEMLTQVQTTLLPLDPGRQVVITDTYVARWLATAAMYGANDLERLVRIYRRLPAPDVSFHLELEPAQAHARIESRPKGDRVMGAAALGKLNRYHEGFRRSAPFVPYRQHRISTTGQIAETAARMTTVLRSSNAAPTVLLSRAASTEGGTP